MSQGPIATASVKVVPDLKGFATLLRTEVNASIRSIKLTPLKVPVIAAPHRTSLRNEVNASVRSLNITPIRVPVVAAPVGGAAGGAAAAAAGGLSAAGGGSVGRVTKEVEGATKATNALRGSLIGLSHVTPVTVFGLGLYGTAALATGLAVKSAISSTADFEHQLNIFKATTGATATQMKAIEKESKQLGADLSLPSTSAGDAARAMTELAKAGLTVKDTLAGARGVLQLAAAAQLDVGSAATFVATELNAFGLAGDKATHVADLLAGASIAAQGEITDFGTAFQQVSAVAKQADVSLETTTGALVELAKAGLKGADGGTSLRTALLRLTPTTKQAAQYQKALGIELDQNKTIGQQFPQLLDQYKASLAGLTAVQRQQAITQIFGQDAFRAASILIEGGSAALARNTAAADKNGAANRLAAANARGLSGAWNGLKSNIDTLGITLGQFTLGPLTGLVNQLSDGVTAASDLAAALAAIPDSFPNLPGGGGGGKDGKDGGFLGTGFGKSFKDSIKSLFTTSPEVAKQIDDFLTVVNQGGFVRPGETPADALKRINAEKKQRKNISKIADQGTFGIGTFKASQAIQDVQKTGGTFGVSEIGTGQLTAKQKKARDAINALISAASKPKKVDVTPPDRLVNAKLQAQLNDNIQAELKADQAIEAYLRKRLKLAQGKPKIYQAVLEALSQAHAATQSVLGQITSNNEQAAQERQAAIVDAVNLQRTRLENAAELTDHQGEAERKLIAFYLAESKDLRLEESARLGYEAAYNTERKSQKAAIVAQAKAEIDLRNARLDLAIQRATLTDTPADDRRAINAKIKKLQGDIDAINKIKKKTTEQKRAIIDLQSEILSLRAQAKSLNGAQTGFSLQDLFKEAANQFNTFGSNISARNGVLSGQDERAAFGKTVLGNRDRAVTLQGQQLTQQEKTNTILEQILAKIGHTGNGGAGGSPALDDKGKKGNLLAIYGTEIAAAYNYGVN